MNRLLSPKRLIKLATLFAMLFSIPGSAEEQQAVQAETQISYLYIIQAKDGHIEPTSADGKQGTLVLDHVSKSAFFFSERPNRKAGKTALEKFLSNWASGQNSFKQDHPNASLVFANSDKNQLFTSIRIILRQPKYNKSEDSLTFTIQVLDGQTLTKQDLGEAVIFIDSYTAPLQEGRFPFPA